MIRYLFVYRVKFENILQVVSTSFTVIIVSIVSLNMRISRDILLIFHMQLSLMIDELENPLSFFFSSVTAVVDPTTI